MRTSSRLFSGSATGWKWLRSDLMKIFARLYTGIVLILVFVLIVSGLIIVNTSLNKNIEHEIENGVERHNIVQSLLKSNIVISTRSQPAVSGVICKAAQNTKTGEGPDLAVLMDGEPVYGDFDFYSDYSGLDEGLVKYNIKTVGGNSYIECGSVFTMRDVRYTCITCSDISRVISENNSLRHSYRLIYIVMLITGAAFALAFSLYITKPVRRLSDATRAISEGDYSHRIDTVTNDELGNLTKAYNSMAGTIEEKISDLEKSVRSKEDFIAAFAHETKTPVTGIIGYADLIYQGKLSGSEIKDAAGVIMSEGERLKTLSGKLLELTELNREESSLMTEEISASDLENDLAGLLKIDADKRNIEIAYDIEDGYFWADYDLIRSVLVNLIENSMKAGAKHITVKGVQGEGDAFTFKVTDDGMGIPADKVSRVKEAFYMVDRSRTRAEHGAGLGLSLCDRIVKLHGGTMDITSEEGKGTEITVFIPDRPERKNT